MQIGQDTTSSDSEWTISIKADDVDDDGRLGERIEHGLPGTGTATRGSIFSFVVVGSGYCRHRLVVVAATYLAAVGALLVGAFALHGMGAIHAATLAGGGVLLGCAHALNRRGVMRHGCARSLWIATGGSAG